MCNGSEHHLLERTALCIYAHTSPPENLIDAVNRPGKLTSVAPSYSMQHRSRLKHM